MFHHPLVQSTEEMKRPVDAPAFQRPSLTPGEEEARVAARLRPETPAAVRGLWRTALRDIESNLVETEQGVYFGAGRIFGPVVFTRDIAYAGLLSLNRLHPAAMDASLRHTRRTRLGVGLAVPRESDLEPLGIDCEVVPLTEQGFLQKHRTNSFARRTDDAVWLAAAHDLYTGHPRLADWDWLLKTGSRCYEELYDPFFDTASGLFRGQASFIDVHYGPGRPASGYPQAWTLQDCLAVRATSTNALHFAGMRALADAASRLGRRADAERWATRAAALREAIRGLLRLPSGGMTYFLHPDGRPEPRVEALGAALCVLLGVLEPAEGAAALQALHRTPHGFLLIHPPLPHGHFYHNHAAWPFVDALVFRALRRAGIPLDPADELTGLAACCNAGGSFWEVVDTRSGEHAGSTRQLWSAAAYAGLCLDHHAEPAAGGPGRTRPTRPRS